MALSKKKRFEIFKRDNFHCVYCGRKVPDVILEIDHIIPKSKKGTDDESNLVTSCFDCNRGKGKQLVSKVKFTKIDKKSIKTRQEKIEQLREYEKLLKKLRRKEEKDVVDICKHFSQLTNNKIHLNQLEKNDIKNFLKKLPKSEIIDAFDISFSRNYITKIEDKVKYAYGVCHYKTKGTYDG